MKRFLILMLFPVMALADGLWAERGEPWVEIHGRDRQGVDPNVVAVLINRIDERSFIGEFEVGSLAVGEHEVVFQTTRSHKSKTYEYTQAMTIDAKPCTRYYVSAYHLGRNNPRFEVKVDREEVIKGCAAKHNVEVES